MKKVNVINEIVKGKPLSISKEISEWISESDSNQEEYIRFKNLWALLQQGNKMDSKYIAKDFKIVRSKIDKKQKKYSLYSLLKYAALIFLAIMGGYFIATIKNNLPRLSHEITQNEIFVPNGNRSQIVLPDGSEVWLSNGSKIMYPDFFSGDTRIVKLEGEAYFKVTHDAEKPFIVNVGEQRIRVLGTEFSVVAYPNDNLLQVDLVTGKVQFEVKRGFEKYNSYVLNPLHSLVFDKTSGNLTSMEIPDSFYKYWMEGMYEFENEKLGSLAKKIERIYGVEIIFDDENMKNELKFTGAFFIDSNIYTIIETFKRASNTPFEYTINKNKIHLKYKK